MKESTNRLVVISYRLPFHVEEGALKQNSGGLVSAMLSYAKGKTNETNITSSPTKIVWVGVSEDSIEDLANAKRDEDQDCFEMIPIHLDEEMQQSFYEGFCNNEIWPLFHCFSHLAHFSSEDYEQYQKANQFIADHVLKYIQPGDRLWIHDYHFLLLPRLLRNRFSDIEIGFFLHIPFPSYEIFRLFPRSWREDLLLGMLGADLIGFHTFDYIQHFSQCVIRMISAQVTGSWITTEEGSSRIEAFPIGIDAQAFAKDRFSPIVQKKKEAVLEAIENRALIFSVDRLDYTKGLSARLLAIEKFFSKYPEWKNKVVFNMVVVPSRDTIPSYREMKLEIESHVGRINGLISTLDWRPVVYQYRHLKRDEMIALYSLSDVALITPLRDGMNLVAKEFVASQPPEKPGVLILSEMAGTSAELREALIINPNDNDEIADTLKIALEMPVEEKRVVWNKLQDRVHSYDVFAWSSDFLHSLSNSANIRKMKRTTPLIDKEVEVMQASYMASSKRAILLDYDGTLVPFHRDPEKAVPSPQVHEILSRLCSDPKNEISIISGRNRSFLERWFGDLPLHLVAEHGASQRLIGKEWEYIWNESDEWKISFREIMLLFVQRCPGSFIENKRTSLVWHYRNADPIYGVQIAKDLIESLKKALHNPEEFKVLEGNHIVEVRPGLIDKGSAALRVFNELKHPFILAIGDDRTDEDLFSVLPEHAYGVKVGKGNTQAKYQLRDPSEVVRLLEYLAAPQGNWII